MRFRDVQRTQPIGRDRIRSRADTALYFGSDWMAMLIILFSVMLFCFGSFYLSDTFLFVLSLFKTDLPMETMTDAVFLLLFVFLSPLIPGVLSYAYDLYRAAHGEISGRVPATEIFHCYASPRLMFSAAIDVAVTAALFCLPPAVLIGAWYLIPRIPGFVPPYLLLTAEMSLPVLVPTVLSGLFAFLCFLAALYLCATLSPALFLSVARPELSFFARIKYSFLCMRPHAGIAVFALFRFGILSVLSLVFVGIPFFVYLLPHAIFTYVGFSQEISNAISI